MSRAGAPLWLLVLAAAVLALAGALAHDGRYRVAGPDILDGPDFAAGGWRLRGAVSGGPAAATFAGRASVLTVRPAAPGPWLAGVDWRLAGIPEAGAPYLRARLRVWPLRTRDGPARAESVVFHTRGDVDWRHTEAVVHAPAATMALQAVLQLRVPGAELAVRHLSLRPLRPAPAAEAVTWLLRLGWAAWIGALLLRLRRLTGRGRRGALAAAVAFAAIVALLWPRPADLLERPILSDSFLAGIARPADAPALAPWPIAPHPAAYWLTDYMLKSDRLGHVALFTAATIALLLASPAAGPAWATLLLCAGAGEAMQLATVGRGVNLNDATANLIGLLLGTALVWLWRTGVPPRFRVIRRRCRKSPRSTP